MSVAIKSRAPQAGRVPWPRLESLIVIQFPKHLEFCLSSFRKSAIRKLASYAWEQFGTRLRAVTISRWETPDEENSWRLAVEVECDASWEVVEEGRYAILARLAELANTWTKEQRDDFSKRIYLELQASAGE